MKSLKPKLSPWLLPPICSVTLGFFISLKPQFSLKWIDSSYFMGRLSENVEYWAWQIECAQ